MKSVTPEFNSQTGEASNPAGLVTRLREEALALDDKSYISHCALRAFEKRSVANRIEKICGFKLKPISLKDSGTEQQEM